MLLALLCGGLLVLTGLVQAQVGSPPARPTGLTVEANHDSVSLSWDSPADASISHYEILRRDVALHAVGLFFTIEANTGSAETTYTDHNVTAQTRYVYRVKAVNAHGPSQWSSFASADTPPNPADLAPTMLTAAAIDTGVGLNWQAPAAQAVAVTGYEILRAVGQGPWTTLLSNSASTETSYTDAGATQAGETYRYEVRALRDTEKSQASNQAALSLPPEPVEQSAPKSEQTVTLDGQDDDSDLQPLPSTQGVVYTWEDGDRTLQARLQVALTVTKDGGIGSRETIVRSDAGSTTAQKSAGQPVFRSPSGALMTLPGGVLLVLDAAWDQAAVDDFFVRNQIGVSRVSELGWLPNGFFVDTEPGFPSLNLANALAGQDGVVLSSPNWRTESTLY